MLIEIRDNGVLVGSEFSTNGHQGRLLDAAGLPLEFNKCGKIGPGLPCFTACTVNDFTFFTNTGLAYTGDDLRLLAPGAQGQVSTVAALTITGTELPSFTAAQSSAAPPARALSSRIMVC